MVPCQLSADHDGMHSGQFAAAKLRWSSNDRRDYTGDDPGQCDAEAPAVRDDAGWSNVDAGPGSRCILPAGHPGRHAS